MRGALLLLRILNVTVWASTSPQTWTLSPAVCLPKDRPVLKAVRHKVDPWRLGVLGRDAGESLWCLFVTYSLGQNPQSHPFLTADVLCVVPWTPVRRHDPHHEADSYEKSRMSTELYRSQGGHWHWRHAGVPPETALGLMRQMTGAKIMPVVGGRCCQRRSSWNVGCARADRSLWTSLVLVLCHCLGPLVQKWCDQGFCVDVDGNPLAAWAYADDLFLAVGAAWKMTRMLSELSASAYARWLANALGWE